jgi:hypothetical protein
VLKIIVGLPGCGKTTLMQKMESEDFRIFDDFHANAFGDSSDVEMSQKYFPLMDALLAEHNCAVSDIAFCMPERRSALLKAIRTRFPNEPIEWIYFENSPEKCRSNIQRRKRERMDLDLKALESIAERYVIPAGITVLPIHSENSETL